MENLIQSEIFFFISSVSFIILTILLGVAVIYIISILQDFKSISRKIKNGADYAGDHMEELAKNIEESSFYKFIFGKKRKSRKSKTD
jgi:hypothetical protein